jgi:hypothetical protein
MTYNSKNPEFYIRDFLFLKVNREMQLLDLISTDTFSKQKENYSPPSCFIKRLFILQCQIF